MSIEAAVFRRLRSDDALVAAVGLRIYPDVAPPGTALPYMTYQVISTDRFHYSLGASGSVESRVQVDVWSATSVVRRQLSDHVRFALDGYHGTTEGVFVESIDTDGPENSYEEPTNAGEVGVYRGRFDLLAFHREALPAVIYPQVIDGFTYNHHPGGLSGGAAAVWTPDPSSTGPAAQLTELNTGPGVQTDSVTGLPHLNLLAETFAFGFMQADVSHTAGALSTRFFVLQLPPTSTTNQVIFNPVTTADAANKHVGYVDASGTVFLQAPSAISLAGATLGERVGLAFVTDGAASRIHMMKRGRVYTTVTGSAGSGTGTLSGRYFAGDGSVNNFRGHAMHFLEYPTVLTAAQVLEQLTIFHDFYRF